ncbi:MAG: hypothetical protein WBI63_09365 [Coriobacteriia bacterium]
MSEACVTLQQHLAAVGRMPLGTGLALIDALLERVGEGHRDGVTDGALTPARIAVVDGSRPLVLAADEAGSAADADAYLSPQQRDGKPADPRADVYALGVIAYKTLTGAMPFASGAEAPEDPVVYLPNLTDAVRKTLLIALQHNLTERFADALTMRAALRGDSQVALECSVSRRSAASVTCSEASARAYGVLGSS